MFITIHCFNNMGLFLASFWNYVFPFSWSIVLLQMIKITLVNGVTWNRKEAGTVRTILILIVRKSLTPSENRLKAILNWKKAKVRPRIRTRSAQTECHRFTACATTTSSHHVALIELKIAKLWLGFSGGCRKLLLFVKKFFISTKNDSSKLKSPR